MFISKLGKAIFQSLVVLVFSSKLVSAQSVDPKAIKLMANGHLETAQHLINLILEAVVKYSFQVLGGLIVLMCGWMAGRYISNIISGLLKKHSIDVTIAKFIISAVKLMVMLFATIVALGKFGIEVAPLIAGVSVAGFGLSFALQGPLSNYASGATLIFTKPFKVGDIIEVAGVSGEVTDIKLPRTEIKTVDGTTIVVPNKHITGEIIHNYSNFKRLDLTFGISYKSNVDDAIRVIKDTLRSDARVLREPLAGISQFADSSINIFARLWCRQDDYWQLMFDANKAIWDVFKKQGIHIPFPQRDVHIYADNRKT